MTKRKRPKRKKRDPEMKDLRAAQKRLDAFAKKPMSKRI